MTLKVRQSRPNTLREAVKAALELESFQLPNRQRSQAGAYPGFLAGGC